MEAFHLADRIHPLKILGDKKVFTSLQKNSKIYFGQCFGREAILASFTHQPKCLKDLVSSVYFSDFERTTA
jgi:hypothetical protein